MVVIVHFGHSREAGQALTESLLLLMVLAILWVFIPYLGDLSDISLKTQHLANLKVWQESKGLELNNDEHLSQDLASLEDRQRWLDLRGKELLRDVSTSKSHSPSPSVFNLGGTKAQEMRHAWQIQDHLSSFEAQANVSTMEKETLTHGWLKGLFAGNEELMVRRRMALLVGAGHASSRVNTQEKIEQSETLWGQSMRRSEGASKQVLERMRAVDAPWRRPEPSFSWLTPWASLMPEEE